jgi:uncharacterized NAD(P)/FAD-binding protein YdhS
MSAFPDDPDHFWRWLSGRGHTGGDRFCFAPRAAYGHYLASLVEGPLAAAPEPRVRWLRKTVVARAQRDGSVVLRFSDAEAAAFDIAILWVVSHLMVLFGGASRLRSALSIAL